MPCEHLRPLLERPSDSELLCNLAQELAEASTIASVVDVLRRGRITATAPIQFALTTRSGCECVAHAVQALIDVDGRATILSIDGIGAFHLVSRGAMLEGLRTLDGSDALPFVKQFWFAQQVHLGRRRGGEP